LLPIEEISPELRSREQDYQFIEVDPSCIEVPHQSPLARAELVEIQANPETHKIWICANLHIEQANIHYPIYQTYLDTCLVGCFDSGIVDFASEFIKSTHFWEHGWINDRHQTRYPRAARVTLQQREKIDQLLQQHQVLEFRQEIER
jgi:hypothetical protein